MIAPEQWYEQQKQYMRYGIDMKPKSDRVPISERRKREKPFMSKGLQLSVVSDHRIMLMLILIAVMVLMSVVIIASYSAKLTYDINTIKAENDVLNGEIEDLDAQISSAETIAYVEEKAKGELGMKNPDSKHCVYLSDCDVPEEGFANILREKAYN